VTNIQLVRLDPALEEALTNHPECMQALVQDDWVRLAEVVHQLIGRTLAAIPISVDELQWGGYFVVDADTRQVVGSCAYKSPPTTEGTVEIAYFTYPGFEGRGYATAMARKLIALAHGSPAVRHVIAHTLPEANASTRVLERVGIALVGEVTDPEDGLVWRWQMPVGA
jgi:RimJ/RimL family protein N-acetyltransferase